MFLNGECEDFGYICIRVVLNFLCTSSAWVCFLALASPLFFFPELILLEQFSLDLFRILVAAMADVPIVKFNDPKSLISVLNSLTDSGVVAEEALGMSN
jgi:hypothetical protein